jgi:hypothetical protein
MKMVGHKAISQKIAIGQQVLAHFSEEKQVIVVAEKNRLAIVALIIYVEYRVEVESHRC